MAGTVSVGCKLPHGLHLQLYNMVPGMAAEPIGERVTLKGANEGVSVVAPIMVEGAFGVTENIDKDFMERWLKDNASHAAVKGGMIFVQDKTVSVKAEGAAKKALKTGFEGVDPKKKPAGIQDINDKD
jgi:hypothetical protein